MQYKLLIDWNKILIPEYFQSYISQETHTVLIKDKDWELDDTKDYTTNLNITLQEYMEVQINTY